MKIKYLKAPSFKGADIKLQFSDVNLIVGENFSGKSAIPQAIEVGNYGALLSLGETNERTFRLCSDPREMFISVTFDDDTSNMFALSRSEDGSIKKKEERAHTLPRVMIDAQEYFEQTEQERLKYVLQRTNMKRCGYDEREFYDQMFPESLRKGNKSEQKVALSWGREWDKALKQIKDTKASVIDFMDALLMRMKKAKSETDKRVKSAKPIIAALEQARPYENVAKDRDEAQKVLIALKARDVQDDTQTAIEDLEDAIGRDENQLRLLKDDMKECDVEEQKMRKLKQCPTCKSAGKDWLKPWLENHALKKANLQKGIDDARKGLAEQQTKLESLKNKKPNKAKLELEKEIEHAQARFDDLDGKQINYLSYVHEQQRLTETRQQLEDDRCESDVLSTMIDALVDYQKKLVEKAFAMLLKTATSFTIGLLKGDLAYHEGQLGYWKGKLFVNHATFSGTEKLLSYAGLQIALAQESPCKYIVFDEMGRVHPKMKVRVVSRLLSLISDGTIDQAFLIDTTSVDYKEVIAKLQLIELN